MKTHTVKSVVILLFPQNATQEDVLPLDKEANWVLSNSINIDKSFNKLKELTLSQK